MPLDAKVENIQARWQRASEADRADIGLLEKEELTEKFGNTDKADSGHTASQWMNTIDGLLLKNGGKSVGYMLLDERARPELVAIFNLYISKKFRASGMMSLIDELSRLAQDKGAASVHWTTVNDRATRLFDLIPGAKQEDGTYIIPVEYLSAQKLLPLIQNKRD